MHLKNLIIRVKWGLTAGIDSDRFGINWELATVHKPAASFKGSHNMDCATETSPTTAGKTGEQPLVYASYNEGENGTFDQAIQVSNDKGCLVWFGRNPIDPKRFEQKLPLPIVVRISGKEEYYKGCLVNVLKPEQVNVRALLTMSPYRPKNWSTNHDPQDDGIKSVLFITNLHQVNKPEGVAKVHPPVNLAYINF